MTSKFSRTRAAFALVSSLTLGTAAASVITVAYDVTASNFVTFFASVTPPYDPVTGTFSVTFDNAADIMDSASIAGNFSVPFNGPLLFTYHAATDRLDLGASGTTNSIAGGDSDFGLFIATVSTAPTAISFTYTTPAFPNAIFGTTDVALSRPNAVAVPEPGLLALMGLGMSALCIARRRRRG